MAAPPARLRRPLIVQWILWVAAGITLLLIIVSARYRIVLGPVLKQKLDLSGARIEYRFNAPNFNAPPSRPLLRWHVHGEQPSLGWLAPDWHLYPTWWFARVPLWIPLLLTGGGAAVLLWRERHRREHGLCPTCGYALEGLPTTGGAVKCPECGKVERDSDLESEVV